MSQRLLVDTEGKFVVNRSEQSPPSPLDDVMVRFLDYVQRESSGFAAGQQSKLAAEATGVPEPLIDAVFISARTRSLITPDFNARGRTRWIVSTRGHQFLEHRTLGNDTNQTSGA